MTKERLRVRERMPERERRVQDYEWDEIRQRSHASWSKLMSERPRVVKGESVPCEQSQSAFHKVYTTYDLPTAERKPWTAPMKALRLLLQIVDTGHKNANHRHYPEVPFFILQGKGHEMHDGRRHDWEAGDMMIVPPYCMHQHFCDEGPAILVYCQADHGAITLDEGNEQAERNENWVLPDGCRPVYDDKGTLVGYRRDDQEFFFDNDYEEIDGKRWDCDTHDVVAIPALATHQSFNADPEHPATVLVFKSRLYDHCSYGGIEHLEDAQG